jgi:hypothetical protein
MYHYVVCDSTSAHQFKIVLCITMTKTRLRLLNTTRLMKSCNVARLLEDYNSMCKNHANNMIGKRIPVLEKGAIARRAHKLLHLASSPTTPIDLA